MTTTPSATPTIAAPTTAAPTTTAPITASPNTASPTTTAPTTAAPKTAAPSTATPNTVAPTTAAPTTMRRLMSTAPYHWCPLPLPPWLTTGPSYHHCCSHHRNPYHYISYHWNPYHRSSHDCCSHQYISYHCSPCYRISLCNPYHCSSYHPPTTAAPTTATPITSTPTTSAPTLDLPNYLAAAPRVNKTVVIPPDLRDVQSHDVQEFFEQASHRHTSFWLHPDLPIPGEFLRTVETDLPQKQRGQIMAWVSEHISELPPPAITEEVRAFTEVLIESELFTVDAAGELALGAWPAVTGAWAIRKAAEKVKFDEVSEWANSMLALSLPVLTGASPGATGGARASGSGGVAPSGALTTPTAAAGGGSGAGASSGGGPAGGVPSAGAAGAHGVSGSGGVAPSGALTTPAAAAGGG
ncbi:hypothetical protein CYMTET_20134 [Cymbomonas tetramitiformis]|uniref:Uncharacterized protein n=1 Tax=Cymbomonas tetramitiformis TaxID=36881 RepID=A0AAE0L4L4_9CHLO|nr:hypothetical protein CYMTET_20134 [Cymbomonas tetramitiformis]